MPIHYDRKWKWCVRFYYAKDAPPPKVPESMAIETVHTTDTGMSIEVQASIGREDIGRVEIIRLHA